MCVLRGEADVAGEGQLQAGAEGIALDGADNRPRQLRQAAEGVRVRAAALSVEEGRVPAEAEVIALCGQHYRADVVVSLNRFAGAGQLAQEGAVDGVPGLRPPQRQVGDGAALVH